VEKSIWSYRPQTPACHSPIASETKRRKQQGILAFSHEDDASSKDEGGRLELYMTKLASLENNLEGVGSGDISGEQGVWADRHPPLTIHSSFTNAAIMMRFGLDALVSTNKTPTLFLP
jgi:hypothetical protein